jgi:hypothetical protein
MEALEREQEGIDRKGGKYNNKLYREKGNACSGLCMRCGMES